MLFVKLDAVASAVILILTISMMVIAFSTSVYAHSKDNLLSFSEAEKGVGEKQNDIVRVSAENKTSSSPPNSQVQGILIVTKKVINEDGGDKKPSDFTITIHSNEPSPTSF